MALRNSLDDTTFDGFGSHFARGQFRKGRCAESGGLTRIPHMRVSLGAAHRVHVRVPYGFDVQASDAATAGP